ncbi:heptosyltransferase-2 [Marinobacter persicus]|uniref:lipopolysaccharide heptosyltransferase II n=1 Tax=Marinobacter persicus TaxID=930118 RepID=A0A1I3XA65_9GAMM|nr:lipopolysaccharide heptosyltransferase II [Marinobacter persicus]GHD48847.1 lipopolysaccharide heptosyltransferase II [Marinobacter persicus]SFK15901.1 heptosyltransferase-2 [Marinobacter persicus]
MKYLVVGPSWVGDMVMAQSLFKSLLQQDADARIDVLAPGWSLPIIARMPEVREGIAAPWKSGELAFKEQWRLARSLKDYDKAIVLPRSFKSALIPFLARIPERVGFSGEGRSILLTDARKRRPTRNGAEITDKTVWRYLGLGASKAAYERYEFDVPQPALRIDDANAEQVLAQLGLDATRPAVALCPGAEYGPAKQWPLDYHRSLAGKLVERGYQVWVIGGPKDGEAGATIAGGQERVFNLCGKTRLEDTVDLFSRCRSVVSHDSGLMHVAAAAGADVVAIYGSSSPDFTPPLTDKATIMRYPIECSPCFDRTCRFGHYKCLTQISVDEVLQACQ